MSKKSTSDHEQFRDGIMKLNSHQFGRVGEIVVETLMGYTRSEVTEYDLTDLDGQKVEVKATKVQEGGDMKITSDNFYDVTVTYAKWERLLTRRKALAGKATFACNIQRVKPLLFDRLFYLLFFKDQIEIFAIDSGFLIFDDPDLGYTSRPYGGDLDKGHLRIDGATYPYHKSNQFVRHISYHDLMHKVKAQKSTD